MTKRVIDFKRLCFNCSSREAGNYCDLIRGRIDAEACPLWAGLERVPGTGSYHDVEEFYKEPEPCELTVDGNTIDLAGKSAEEIQAIVDEQFRAARRARGSASIQTPADPDTYKDDGKDES